jgi:hypothetical protein
MVVGVLEGVIILEAGRSLARHLSPSLASEPDLGPSAGGFPTGAAMAVSGAIAVACETV